MRPADAAVTAEALRRVLRAIERGELNLASERHAIERAVLALDAIAKEPTDADRNPGALDGITQTSTEVHQDDAVLYAIAGAVLALDGVAQTPDGDADTSGSGTAPGRPSTKRGRIGGSARLVRAYRRVFRTGP